MISPFLNQLVDKYPSVVRAGAGQGRAWGKPGQGIGHRAGGKPGQGIGQGAGGKPGPGIGQGGSQGRGLHNADSQGGSQDRGLLTRPGACLGVALKPCCNPQTPTYGQLSPGQSHLNELPASLHLTPPHAAPMPPPSDPTPPHTYAPSL